MLNSKPQMVKFLDKYPSENRVESSKCMFGGKYAILRQLT